MQLYSFYLCTVMLFLNPFEISMQKIQMKNPRVCVIGAGIAGLTSARYLKEEGINFTVLEATQYVGGTWRYDPRIGHDENDLPLYTSMYKHLRTNLPKPLMELRGYPVPKDWPSYPSWELYYDYLKSYAKHFDLEKHIQFLHLVTSVKRIENIWKVKHKHVISGEVFEEDCDFVFIGNGHFSTPNLPNILGENVFKGKIIHSHDYKEPDPYKNRRVLIIGAGPSGMDIGLDVSFVSKTLIHSHHSKGQNRTPFPSNYVQKPDVLEFNESGAIFVDGSFEEIDDVIYCTGFQYNYPFLDDTCGVKIRPRSITPLYRNTVNINQPSMIFLGLVARACIVVSLDAQSRYATALVKGNFTLPSKQEMLNDFNSQIEQLCNRDRPLSDIHLLGQDEDRYYEALSKESGIERVPPVLSKIRLYDTDAKLNNLRSYRDYAYTVVDNQTFTRELEK